MNRCLRASEACALACESALASDPSYTSPGTEPYSEAQLALVSCASVCTLVARALRMGDGDLELLRWCAETCSQCMAFAMPPGVPEAAWSGVVQACGQGAQACEALVERISRCAHGAIGAVHGTDFRSSLES